MTIDPPEPSSADPPFGDPKHGPVSRDPVVATNAPFLDDFDRANPYAAVRDIPVDASQDPVAVSVNPEPAMRWWTPLAISGVSLAFFLFASGVMALIAIAVVHGELTADLLRDSAAIQLVSQSRIGLFLLVVPAQIALVAPAIVAAYLSPVPTRERLGLVRGHWPLWAWFAAAAATPLVGLASGLIVGMFMDESESLREMSKIFREHGETGFLLPLAFMIGATPAICEELLFRGYVQTRLVRSFGPLFGIAIASFLFAIFHMDLVHVIAVFPLGVFLGWLTWQSGSLFPAMMAHFVNNVISVIGVVVAPEGEAAMVSLPAVAFTLVILGLGFTGMVAVSIASYVYRRPRKAESSLTAGTAPLV